MLLTERYTMSDLLSQFLEVAGTYRVLEEHGITIKPMGRHQCVVCADPACGASACIQGTSLVCTALHGCNWRAGHVVDYLSHARGWSTHATLQRIHEQNPRRFFERLGGLDWSLLSEQLALDIDNRRAVLQFLLDHRGVPATPTMEVMRLVENLRCQGVDLHKRQLTVFVLPATACKELAALVGEQVNSDFSYDYPCCALVRPMFSDYLTLSHIDLHPLEKRYQMVSWDLAPSDVSFSGLWEVRGGDLENVTVLRKSMQAAVMTQRAVTMGRSQTFLGMESRLDAEEEAPLKFTRVRYMAQLTDPLRGLVEVKNKTERGGFTVCRAEDPETTYSWLEFLTQRFEHHAKQERNAGAVRRDLESLELTDAERAEWIPMLKSRGLGELVELVDKHAELSDSQFEVRGATIGATRAGYFVTRPGKGRHPVTNFTLTFERNLLFPDSKLFYHAGLVNFQGLTCPVLILRENLMRPPLLEACVQQAVTAVSKDLLSLPLITDKALAAPLFIHFNNQVSTLSLWTGVSRLGWSADRKTFTSPAWQADRGQVLWRDTCPDPGVVGLQSYDFTPGSVDPTVSTASHLAGELLALLVAQAARIQRARPTRPLLFRDTGTVQTGLLKLFRQAFRQNSPLLWNAKTGTKEIEFLHGHPCLAVGTGDAAVTLHPLFILSDTGRVFEEQLTDADCDFIAGKFAECMRWLMQESADQLDFKHTPLYEHDLLVEGCAILYAACGYQWTGTLSDMPATEALLSLFSPASLGDLFRENFAAQRLIIRTSRCPKEIKELIFAELSTADATFVAGDYASMDLVHGRSVLNSFYRQDVALPRITTTTPDELTWAAKPETTPSLAS